MLKFSHVVVLLGVFYADEAHEHICSIREFTDGEPYRLKVARCSVCYALVDDVAVGHQQQSIKVVECFRTRLVYRADNSLAFVVGETLQGLADLFGHK